MCVKINPLFVKAEFERVYSEWDTCLKSLNQEMDIEQLNFLETRVLKIISATKRINSILPSAMLTKYLVISRLHNRAITLFKSTAFIRDYIKVAKASFRLELPSLLTVEPHPLVREIAAEIFAGNSMEVDTSLGYKEHGSSHGDGILGKGGYGRVVAMKIGDTKFALKETHLSCLQLVDVEEIDESAEIRNIVNEALYGVRFTGKHPNVGSIAFAGNLTYPGREESTFAMVMEPGTVGLGRGIGKLKTPFTEESFKKLVFEIASGIKFLHQNGLVHRDLKPDNCLFFEDGSEDPILKIIDFGQMKTLAESGGAFGSPNYLPPEILSGGKSGTKIDSWQLGVIIYTRLFKEVGIHEEKVENIMHELRLLGKLTQESLLQKICQESSLADDLDPSFALRHLLTKLLVKEPSLRITVEEALKHPYFSGSLEGGFREEIHALQTEISMPKGDVGSPLEALRDKGAGESLMFVEKSLAPKIAINPFARGAPQGAVDVIQKRAENFFSKAGGLADISVTPAVNPFARAASLSVAAGSSCSKGINFAERYRAYCEARVEVSDKRSSAFLLRPKISGENVIMEDAPVFGIRKSSLVGNL